MQSGLALPFQGEIYGGALTHRVAVGCYALPLQGGGKLAILPAFLAIFNDFYIKIPMLMSVLPTVRNMSYKNVWYCRGSVVLFLVYLVSLFFFIDSF
ncbi:MAG: hypothetical protein LBL62_05270 [Planctomycetaceae bacterium]|jgi:type II secretory pathway component PulF|nr:hypothetical protein [Planctomycetaceae bacterium]